MHSDLAAFHAYLDDHPEDHQAREIFADWLEEQGGELSRLGPGYRALGRLGMTPAHLQPCPNDSTADYWMWQLLPWRGNGYQADTQPLRK